MFRKILKHLLVMSNSSGSVLGASMIISGYIVLTIFKQYLTIFNAVFIHNVMMSMMILGGVVLGLTIMGSVGAIFEGTFGKYVVLVPIFLVMQIYVTVILYDYRGSRKNKVYRKAAASSISNNDNDIYTGNVTLVDTVKFLPLFPTLQPKYDGSTPEKRNIDLKTDKQYSVSKRRRKNRIYDDTAKVDIEYDNANDDVFRGLVDSETDIFDSSYTSDGRRIRRDSSRLGNWRVKGRTSKKGRYISNTMDRESKGPLTNAWIISTILGWLLPKKLEPDSNVHVKKLKPLLGALSKPLLFISLNTAIMVAAIITAVVEGVSFFIAIYLAITKEEDVKEDEED